VISDELITLYRVFLFDTEQHYAHFIKRCLAHPNNGIALANAALASAELGADDTLVLFARAIALIPDEAVPYVNRGDFMRLNERYDEALADYSAAVTRDPENPYFRRTRAGLLHKLGRFDEAVADYDVAIRVQPDFRPTHEARERALARQPPPVV
jgi:tetratricopeptide (TPR) repeat protein